jgi:hypothetical protein
MEQGESYVRSGTEMIFLTQVSESVRLGFLWLSLSVKVVCCFSFFKILTFYPPYLRDWLSIRDIRFWVFPSFVVFLAFTEKDFARTNGRNLSKGRLFFVENWQIQSLVWSKLGKS